MNIKCFNCELKDGVIVYYKDILFCSKECEPETKERILAEVKRFPLRKKVF